MSTYNADTTDIHAMLAELDELIAWTNERTDTAAGAVHAADSTGWLHLPTLSQPTFDLSPLFA